MKGRREWEGGRDDDEKENEKKYVTEWRRLKSRVHRLEWRKRKKEEEGKGRGRKRRRKEEKEEGRGGGRRDGKNIL